MGSRSFLHQPHPCPPPPHKYIVDKVGKGSINFADDHSHHVYTMSVTLHSKIIASNLDLQHIYYWENPSNYECLTRNDIKPPEEMSRWFVPLSLAEATLWVLISCRGSLERRAGADVHPTLVRKLTRNTHSFTRIETGMRFTATRSLLGNLQRQVLFVHWLLNISCWRVTIAEFSYETDVDVVLKKQRFY